MTLELSSLHFVFACDAKTLSALRFVFACDTTTSRALFCVCLYSNNLARSGLSLFVTQQLSPLYSIFACDARTNRAPFRAGRIKVGR